MLRHLTVFTYLVCSTTLPILDNGNIDTGMNADPAVDPYFTGHDLTYVCIAGYDTTENPLTCTCTASADPDNIDPSWECSADFDTTCRRSK